MLNMFKLFVELKSQGKRIGFTCGTFDLLHPGHVMMLEESKANCDFLVVGLLSDPTISRPDTKQKPVETMYMRYIRLQGVGVVDMIIPFDTEEDIVDILHMIEPDIRFVGEEYKGVEFTGKKLTPLIIYNKRRHPYSSTNTRKRVSSCDTYPKELRSEYFNEKEE